MTINEILQEATEILALLYKIQLYKKRFILVQSTLGMVSLSSSGINLKTQDQKEELHKQLLNNTMGIGYRKPNF